MRTLRARLTRLEALTDSPGPPETLTAAEVDAGWRLVEAFHRERTGVAPPEQARLHYLEVRSRAADGEE